MPKWIDKLKQKFGEGDHSDASGHGLSQHEGKTLANLQRLQGKTHGGNDVAKPSGEAQLLGLVSDPRWCRDSGVSVRVGDRQLWTWRDSTHWPGQPFFFTSSTASWSDFDEQGRPKVENGLLRLYGDSCHESAYFPMPSKGCHPHSGAFDDGSRRTIWPDTKPLVVDLGNGDAALYTWIKQAHLKGMEDLDPTPATALYRADFQLGNSFCAQNPPQERLVQRNYWPRESIAYGSYGYLIGIDGYAYLYGKLSDNKGISLARVPLNNIEDPSTATFYTKSKGWSSGRPGMDDSDAAIPNAGAGGQGDFYHSQHLNSFVWIGSGVFPSPDFFVATSPSPEGPWTEPAPLYTGVGGESHLPAYSCVAHPGLSEREGNGKDIYLTYTRVDKGPNNEELYTTPLVRLEWQ